jgi:hypothetical protein
MLADGVHVRDGRAGGEKGGVDGLFVGERQAGGGRAEERGGAAGDEGEDKVVGGEV